MILNMVGGGGSILNFKVVPGTTKPTDPKENTIWANSQNSMYRFDISPTEPHRVSKRANQIVYPFYQTTKTENGVKFTDMGGDDRGVVTVNGTATANAYFRMAHTGLNRREIILEPGEYHLSGCPEGGSKDTHRIGLSYSYDNWKTSANIYDVGSGVTFTLDKPAKVAVAIGVMSGTTVTNAVYRPQLEKGSTATSFNSGNATGQIWIKTDAKSDVSMNAIKKNGIIVHPRAVYEYTTIDGWIERDAEIYQYGTWTQFPPDWDGYFYKPGNECEDITGGWTTEGWTSSAWNVLQLAQKNTNHLYVVGQTSGMSAVGTVQKVDLSDINTLKASINQTGGTFTLCISESKNHSNSVATKQNTTTGSREISLDVSGYNGSYYIILFAHGAGSEATITNVWGE